MSKAVANNLSLMGEVDSATPGRVRVKPLRARALRRNMTEAEKQLWWLLSNKAFENYKFRRQHPVGNYIADFACVEKLLIIEADGGQHNDNDRDDLRTAWLHQKGWRVIRFWNNEVLANPDGVLQAISQALQVIPAHRVRPKSNSQLARTAAPSPDTLTRADLSHEGEVMFAVKAQKLISLEGVLGDA